MKNQFYTYIHLNLETYEIFYVGKGTDRRAYARTKRNEEWKKYVNGLKNEYKVLILKDNQTSEESKILEQMIIKKIGSVIEGGTLLNRAGLGFNPNLIIPIIIEDKENKVQSKYMDWSDEEIIADLLHFPNMQSGELAKKRFEEIMEEFNEAYDEIEEYSEEILYFLDQLYYNFDCLIDYFIHSSLTNEELIEELESIEEDNTEFRKEKDIEINELIERVLSLIEIEIKKFKKEIFNY